MVSQIMAEREEGLREGSVISRESLAAAEDGDEDTWLEIKRELEDFGTITDVILNEHRDFIIDLLKSALAKDDENQSVLADPNSGDEQYEATDQASAHAASEIMDTMNAVVLTDEKSQGEFRSTHGLDDDISEYLIDDLYDALSFYEMFCQEPTKTSKSSQQDLSHKLYLLGRSIKVIQHLTSANAEFWISALSKAAKDAEEALDLTEAVVEHWLSTKINEGLWEPGTARLSKLKSLASMTLVEAKEYIADNNVLTIKDNLKVVQTEMRVHNSSLPLRRVMHQQIAACQLSLLVLQWYAPISTKISQTSYHLQWSVVVLYSHVTPYTFTQQCTKPGSYCA